MAHIRFRAPIFSEVRRGQEQKFVLVHPTEINDLFSEGLEGVSEIIKPLIKDACTQIRRIVKEKEDLDDIRLENFTYANIYQNSEEGGYLMSEICVDAAFAWICLGASIGIVDPYNSFLDYFPNPGNRRDDPLFWDICFALGGEKWLKIPEN